MPPKIQNTLLEQNPIRALSNTALQILADVDGKSNSTLNDRGVIQLQLGNPRFSESEIVAKSMIASICKREIGFGYDSHFGTDNDRLHMAKILERFYALPDQQLRINPAHVYMTNGATLGINAAISASKPEANDPNGVVLVSRPGYPPYEKIIQLLGLSVGHYDVKLEEGYLLSYQEIRNKIIYLGPQNIRLLIYNYPHNPTGVTLSKNDALMTALVINKLSIEFPNIIFVEEMLYHASINASLELWSIYPFLKEEVKQKTIIIGSGSKFGLAGPRAGFIYCLDSSLANACGNYISLTTAGTGYIPHAGLIEVMNVMDLHQGQLVNEQSNPRYQIANYLQERLNILAKGISDIAQEYGLNSKDIIRNIPLAGMFLWVDFAPLFLNKPIPVRIKSYLKKDKLETANDLMVALLLMNLLNERPVLIAPGQLFADQNPMYARLSCVSPNIQDFYDATRTISALLKSEC